MGRPFDVVIRARRLVAPDGEFEGSVGIRDGRIAAVELGNARLEGRERIELQPDEVLLPGMVDTHVHINDPGRAEWEGFATATKAAAEGGITTLLDMPLNSLPPTTTVEALEIKKAAARGELHVDVGFWGGAVPGNPADLPALHDAGVFGFKCFLLHSGVDEFPPLSTPQLENALRTLAERDAVMIVHAEDAGTIDNAPSASGRTYEGFVRSRPKDAEQIAIERVIELARRTGCRVHILHLSSAGALPAIAAARAEGIRLTVETCPHYLSFIAEEIRDGATEFKACPPIREAANREKLWAGLADGLIDCVVSDHSPCTPDLKRFDIGDYDVAWGGVSSLQLGLSAVWTQARQRGHGLADVVRWMSGNPAAFAGLSDKGALEVGRDADLCVFAPEDAFVVDAERLKHRNAVSPYHQRPLAGVVRETWLRGHRVAGVASGDRKALGDRNGEFLLRPTDR